MKVFKGIKKFLKTTHDFIHGCLKLFILVPFVILISSLFSHDFKKISQKNFFKEISKKTFFKILSSNEKIYNWKGEQMVAYSNCGEEFPRLVGGFPCSFLSDEISENQEPPTMDIEGGRIAVKISKEKSPFGGKVFLISDEEENDRQEFLIQAFYDKDNYISHYFHKNYLVIFKWVGEGKEKSLIKIFQIQFNSKKEILSIQRINFQ